ncbi:MAG: hypothetical protein LUD77_10650 [Clostridiales bacterium]|nr:hypothetical protein [Clostridiales bacterium]
MMNKIIKNVWRCFSGLILAAAAFGFMSVCVLAEEINLGKTGSITIKFVSSETDEPITGSEFTFYQVAVLSEEDNNLIYTYCGDFYYCTEDLSGSLNQALAEKLEEYAKENNAVGTVKTTGTDGTAEFDNLPLGLYLVNETKTSGNYRSAGPFLVALPVYQNNSWVYDITAMPKPESFEESPSETTTESDSGGEGSVETTTEGTETTTAASDGGGGGGGSDDDDDR